MRFCNMYRLCNITQCQHGNVGTFLPLYFFVLYYKTNSKTFFRIGVVYSVISTLVEIGKTQNCVKTLRASCFHTRVDITVYQHGKCFVK